MSSELEILRANITACRQHRRSPVKVLGAVADQYRQKLSGYRNKLQELETRHGMSTDEFMKRFEAGDLGDAGEWFDWDAIAALKTEAERKLGELERAGV